MPELASCSAHTTSKATSATRWRSKSLSRSSAMRSRRHGQRPSSARLLSSMSKITIARPSPILTKCCLSVGLSGLQEEFHLDASQFDDVVVLEGVGRGANFLAVDRGPLVAFHMGDEIALRAPGEDGDLHAGLAERGEGFCELELLAGVAAREKLDRPERLDGLGGCRRARRAWRAARRGRARVLVGNACRSGRPARRLHGSLALR